MFVPVRTLLTAGALVLAAAALPAQTDYRNLDDERPVRSEDAWALEFRAWEWMMPLHYARHAGRGEVEFTPEVMWGAFPNGLVGLKLPFRASDRLGEAAAAGPRLFALISLNAETPHSPGFALRADAILPGGGASGDGVLVVGKAIATRTWGRLRTHANASVTVGRAINAPEADAPGRWSASLAADWTLMRQSTLLIAELYSARPLGLDDQHWEVGAGIRRQMTPSLVLDVGAAHGLGGGGGLALTMGLSRSFSLGTPSVRGDR
ncbi:MAG: hypothetical protein IPJ11_01615 [Gemmatimonadetes bacterium]|nr:hypothetical protein [Gemmatimonadota bacterium]